MVIIARAFVLVILRKMPGMIANAISLIEKELSVD
jgi:hypothetical protein